MNVSEPLKVKRAGILLFSREFVVGDKAYVFSLYYLPKGEKYPSRIALFIDKVINGKVVASENAWFWDPNVDKLLDLGRAMCAAAYLLAILRTGRKDIKINVEGPVRAMIENFLRKLRSAALSRLDSYL